MSAKPRQNQRLLIYLAVLHMVICASCYPTFPQYVQQFNKIYDPAQYLIREGIYNSRVANFSLITTYIPAVNNMTDWTYQEIQSLKGLKQNKVGRVSSKKVGSTRLGAPTTLDWRTSRFVTSVKDQKQCGSCWAFSIIALVQSFLVMTGKQQISINLSQQKLVQCTPGCDCDGGYLEPALRNVKDSVPQESQFPYTNGYSSIGGDICQATGIQTNVQIESYYDLDDSQIIELLQSGPVAITISADNWESYGSGVFSCSSSATINHAVLLVGYTSSAYIVKNSWGTRWGMSGYIYVSRLSNRNCLIGESLHRLTGWQNRILTAFVLIIILMLY